ncbi:MAG: PAS domain S-box protein [Alicyclobacillus sp.]|nr:PAS domain S-box protein [Alicyclobacillus sp.]
MNSPEAIRQRYDSLILHNPDGILVVDAEGRIINANPTCERILGFASSELEGMQVAALTSSFGDMCLNRQAEQIEALLHAGDSVWRRKDGSEVHVQHKKIPTVMNGEVVGFHIVLKDVTEDVQSRDALALATEQLQTIFDTLDIAVWSEEYPSNILTHASGVEKIWGVPLETLIHHRSAWYDAIHPDDVDEVRRKSLAVVERKEPMMHDYRVIRPNGEIRWVHDRTIPIVAEDGSLIRVIGVAVDITEAKLAEEERIVALQALQRSEMLATLGQLAAGIAHEIRNPLTSLRGFVQLIQPYLSDHPSYYDIMSSELDRINAIVSEFLSLAKPHQQSNGLHDLQPVLLETVSLLEGQTLLHNISISIHTDERLPLVRCNAVQMKQVFLNLIKNAIEAMPSGGAIRIWAGVVKEEVCVRIADEGCGIPMEMIARLGEPFFTTKESGVGLGLMVTQQIVRNHGGRMMVESEVHHGTTISVMLPMEAPS